MTTFRGQIPELGRCKCGTAVRADSFRTSDGIRRFRVSGRCESCQALAFNAEHGRSGCEARWAPISGAVLGLPLGGWRDPEPRPDGELSLIPFHISPRLRWRAWDLRHIARIGGDRLGETDHWDDLLAMAPSVQGHQIRVRDFSSFNDPTLLDEVARLDVLVAPATGWHRHAVELLPVLHDTVHIDLGTAVPWPSFSGVPLLPLPQFAWSKGHDVFGFARNERFSSLRTSAVLVAALESARSSPSAPRPVDLLFDWLESYSSPRIGT